MMEVDFLPLTLRQTARRRHRYLRTIVVAAIVAAVAVGLHVLHQARAQSSQAGMVRPDTTRATGMSRDNHDSGVQAKRRVHMTAQSERRLQGTPLEAVLAEVCDLENDSLVIAFVEADAAAGGVTRVRVNGFASTEIVIGMLLGRLSASPPISDVRLTDSREAQFNGRAMREFTIALAIRDGRTSR